MKYLLATTNKAKIRYYGNRLKECGIRILTPEDLNLRCQVDESGRNPVENALLKAGAYNRLSGMPAIALDDGLFLEGVPDSLQPGTHVRRVDGKRLSDAEMIAHYMGLVNQYGQDGMLKGYFLKGVAIVDGDERYRYECKSARCFLNRQSEKMDEGYPLASIQMISALGKFKSELTEEEERETMDREQRGIVEFIVDKIGEMERRKACTPRGALFPV